MVPEFVKNTRTGFTLLEIMVVVIILGILAGIVMAWFASASADAREAARQTDLATLDRQLELYRVQHGDMYPWEWDDVGEDLDLVIAQLTRRTNAYGDVMPDGGNPRQFKYGPYVDKFPTYLFARDRKSEADVSFDDVICFSGESDEPSYSHSDSSSDSPDMSPSAPSDSSSSSSSGGRGRLRR